MEIEQEAQLPQRERASNIALSYGAKGTVNRKVAYVPLNNAIVLGNLREYRRKRYTAKNYFLGATFMSQRVLVYLQPL